MRGFDRKPSADKSAANLHASIWSPVRYEHMTKSTGKLWQRFVILYLWKKNLGVKCTRCILKSLNCAIDAMLRTRPERNFYTRSTFTILRVLAPSPKLIDQVLPNGFEIIEFCNGGTDEIRDEIWCQLFRDKFWAKIPWNHEKLVQKQIVKSQFVKWSLCFAMKLL
jgi:hypothetical protein